MYKHCPPLLSEVTCFFDLNSDWIFYMLCSYSISIIHPIFSKTQQNWDRHSILFSSKSKQTLKYFRFVDKNGTKFSLSNKACGMILGEFRCRLHSSDKKSWKNTKCSSFGVLKLPICIMQMAAEFSRNFLTRILQEFHTGILIAKSDGFSYCIHTSSTTLSLNRIFKRQYIYI